MGEWSDWFEGVNHFFHEEYCGGPSGSDVGSDVGSVAEKVEDKAEEIPVEGFEAIDVESLRIISSRLTRYSMVRSKR